MINSNVMPNGLVARGCLPRNDKLGAKFSIFEEQLEPIPRDQWQALIAANPSSRDLVQRIKKQTKGSCASHSTTQIHECTQVMTFGSPAWIELSPMSVYRNVNGGRDRGSTLGDNLEQMREVGAMPVPSAKNIAALEVMGLDPNHVMAENDWTGSFPSGWKETAKYFRFVEVFDIATFDGLITALLKEFVVGYGRASHAITAVDAVVDNGRYLLDYANSWGSSWGDNGFGRDTESYVSGSIRSYGAYAVRTVEVSDQFAKYAHEMAVQA